MDIQRARRAKLNIVVSLGGQFVTLLCGLIVPRLMIRSFGSVAYGATASIAQFLAYITLLEAGIGGAARAALYKPLAERDDAAVSAVVSEIKSFFFVIGLIFFVYVAVLACTYQYIAHDNKLDWITTAGLVVVISISTFAQYFIGISYSVLLQAAQRTYITQLVSIAATCLNTIAVVILIRLDSSLIVVKLISSLVFSLKPLILWKYVRKHFTLLPTGQTKKHYIAQKWNALGQHIAYFLHSNTDIAVLTVLVDLVAVAVYSVYHMIVAHVQSICASFSTGMESVFGDMIAKKEHALLQRTFGYYETLISFVSVTLLSITAVLVSPFVRIYTAGVTDGDYIQPTFALLLIVSSLLYCLRMPYHAAVMAAGHFRQTQAAAYGEAIINISSSVLLVLRLGLVGVAIGTVLATLFRFCFYAFYLSRHILNRPLKHFAKRILVNFGFFFLFSWLGSAAIRGLALRNYYEWVLCAIPVAAASCLLEIAVITVFYRADTKPLLQKLFKRSKESSL